MIIHRHHHKVTILTPSHHICIEVIHSVNYSNKVSFFKLSVSWEHLYSYRAYKQAHTSANTSGKSFCHSHLPLCEHKQRQTRWWWWYCWHLHITSLPAPSIEDVNAQSTSPRTALSQLRTWVRPSSATALSEKLRSRRFSVKMWVQQSLISRRFGRPESHLSISSQGSSLKYMTLWKISWNLPLCNLMLL